MSTAAVQSAATSASQNAAYAAHSQAKHTQKLQFKKKKSETELTASVLKKDPKHTRD